MRESDAKVRLAPWMFIGILVATIPSILVFLVLWITPAQLTPDSNRYAMAVRGFTNMWFAGKTAYAQPGLLVDFAGYSNAMRVEFGKAFAEHSWGYPPSMLLIAVPFGFLPLIPSFLLWTLLGILTFGLALWARHPAGSVPRGVALACAMAPAFWCCLLSGQTGAIAGALLLTGLLSYPSSPVAGGIMLGLLSVKPQMGFLLPLHLMASRKWKTLIWGGIASLMLVAVSAAIWDVQAWLDYLGKTGPRMTGILERAWTEAPTQTNITSPFMSARALGSPLWLAWTVQLMIAAACAIACWKVSQRMGRLAKAGAEPAARLVGVSLIVGLDLLSVPYSHDYDMPVMAVAVAILFWDCLRRGRCGSWEMSLLALAWTWPGVMVLLPVMFPSLSILSPLLGTASLVSVVLVGSNRLFTSFALVNPVSDSTIRARLEEHSVDMIEGSR